MQFIRIDHTFDHLTHDCTEESTAYISWQCTPDTKSFCDDIRAKWESLREKLEGNGDNSVTVPLLLFEKLPYKTKKGEDNTKLQAVKKEANMHFISTFINKLLPKIIHHRNQLKNYKSVHKEFYELFNAVYLDVDFAENLTIPVKCEPQALHWCHDQATVHSGILKANGMKSYHTYFLDSKIHDHVLADLAIKEMSSEADISDFDVIIIESDNCSGQYKSAQHFHDMQNLANLHNKTVIRPYSVAGHGKGEEDHVGGVAKVSIRMKVAAGGTFTNSEEMVEYLQSKFSDRL